MFATGNHEVIIMSEIDTSKERQSQAKQREIVKNRLKKAWKVVKTVWWLYRLFVTTDQLAEELIDRILEDDGSGPLNNYFLAGRTM